MRLFRNLFLVSLALGSLFTTPVNATVNPNILWQISLGKSGNDQINSIQNTYDHRGGQQNGYIVAGTIDTGTSNGEDYYVAKLNSDGELQWEKTIGGSEADNANYVQQTFDDNGDADGYIIVGISHSTDKDAKPMDGDIGNHGSGDVWVVKLAKELETKVAPGIEWQKMFGGSGMDFAVSVQQVFDPTHIEDGYIIGGETTCALIPGTTTPNCNGDVTNTYGEKDFWLIKIKKHERTIDWQKTIGGNEGDHAYAMTTVYDTATGAVKGYAIAGYSFSSDTVGHHASNIPVSTSDVFVAMRNVNGDPLWEQSFGGSASEGAYDIRQTSDGELMIAAESGSTDGDLSKYNGRSGGWWIIKLRAKDGTKIWDNYILGNSDFGTPYSIQETRDHQHYIIAGSLTSNVHSTSGNYGLTDYLLVRLTSSGGLDESWPMMHFGGTSSEQAFSMVENADGNYVAAGYTNSGPNDTDVISNHGKMDGWVIEVSKDQKIKDDSKNISINIYPNPAYGYVNIATEEILTNALIEIYDLYGNLVGTFPATSMVTNLYLSPICATGTYVIRVTGINYDGKLVRGKGKLVFQQDMRTY